MDLKELGVAMTEALTLRGMIDSLDEKIGIAGAQIELNNKEISRLEQLQSVTKRMDLDKQVLEKDRQDRNAELLKRLSVLNEVGVKLPIQQRFSSGRVLL